MVNFTQDASVLDNEAHEKCLKLIIVYDSSGKGLYNLISSDFQKSS